MTPSPSLTNWLTEAWTHLERGGVDRRSPARHPLFATVSPEGLPEARTVVLRAAHRREARLEVHTDTASAKVAALARTPVAALLVWLPKPRLQIRLTATVQVLRGDEVLEHWAKVPPASRVAYGSLPKPGAPIVGADGYETAADPERFAVLDCTLTVIDLLALGERHRRARFTAETGWSGQWVAP